MNGDPRLQQLAELGQLIRDIELEKLSRLSARRAEIEAEAAALRATESALDSGSAAAIAGADARWQEWREARLKELSVQAARDAAEIEEQRIAARRAFGRSEVLGRLVEEPKPRR